jgi:uncharacterized membrane protein
VTSFDEVITRVGQAIDALGVTIIVLGVVVALAMHAPRLLRRDHEHYRALRQSLARAILIGLEVVIAADIIRTVAISPTLESVGVLAAIVLVRTFLSFTLELEINGHWPWQKPGSDG